MSKKMSKKEPKKVAGDIVDMILRDHKELKALIKIMKDEDSTLTQKKSAFAKFAPALVAHAKPEEKTWYVKMKAGDMEVEGLEGDVEHSLADLLCSQLKRTNNANMFKAKVKVLAELVKHHIEEEEEEMLPSFKRNSKKEERVKLGEQYEKLRSQFL